MIQAYGLAELIATDPISKRLVLQLPLNIYVPVEALSLKWGSDKSLANLIEVFKLETQQSARGNEKYHEHYVFINDNALADNHVRVLVGIASDVFLLQTMGIEGMTEASAFFSNLCGAANAPENQWNMIVASVGEKDEAMLELYRELDTLFAAMQQGPIEISLRSRRTPSTVTLERAKAASALHVQRALRWQDAVDLMGRRRRRRLVARGRHARRRARQARPHSS